MCVLVCVFKGKNFSSWILRISSGIHCRFSKFCFFNVQFLFCPWFYQVKKLLPGFICIICSCLMKMVCKSHNAAFSQRYLAMDMWCWPGLKITCRLFALEWCRHRSLILNWENKIWDIGHTLQSWLYSAEEASAGGMRLCGINDCQKEKSHCLSLDLVEAFCTDRAFTILAKSSGFAALIKKMWSLITAFIRTWCGNEQSSSIFVRCIGCYSADFKFDLSNSIKSPVFEKLYRELDLNTSFFSFTQKHAGYEVMSFQTFVIWDVYVWKVVSSASVFHTFRSCEFFGIPCKCVWNSKLIEHLTTGYRQNYFGGQRKVQSFQEKIATWGRSVKLRNLAKFFFHVWNNFRFSVHW